jgi:hypothetical protein
MDSAHSVNDVWIPFPSLFQSSKLIRCALSSITNMRTLFRSDYHPLDESERAFSPNCDEKHEFASPQDSVFRKHRNWAAVILLVSNVVLFLISVILFSQASRDGTCKNETKTGYGKSSPNHTYQISNRLTRKSSAPGSRLLHAKTDLVGWDFLEQHLHLPPRSIPRSRCRMVADRGDIYHHSTLVRDPLSWQRPSQDCQSTRKLGPRRRRVSSRHRRLASGALSQRSTKRHLLRVLLWRVEEVAFLPRSSRALYSYLVAEFDV